MSGQEESKAKEEIARAKAASDDADPTERIFGLGPSPAPIYAAVRPDGGVPRQYCEVASGRYSNPARRDGEDIPVLSYFAIVGLGQVPRLLLAEANIPYDQLLIVGGEDMSVVANWRDRSPNGLLPSLSGMGVPRSSPLSQSGTIVRFLARRLGMDGGFTERGAADADWLYETAKDMGAHSSLIAETGPDDQRDAAAKMPFSTAVRVAKVLASMPDPKDEGAAVNYGMMQLLNFLRKCEAMRSGCVRDNLGEDLDAFRIAMESRTRIRAFLDSPLNMPFTLNEAQGSGGYQYAGGASLTRGDFR